MKHKPRIAVIGLKGLPAYGGAAAVGENIIEQLKDEFDFKVYSISSHTHLKSRIYNNICYQKVFKAIPLKKLNSLLYYIRAASHAFFGNCDLIHIHHRDAAFIIPILRIRFPVLLTTHGVQLQEISKWKKFSWFFNVQLKYFAKYASTITCVSQSDKRVLKGIYKLNAIYIPNGMSTQIKQAPIADNGYIFYAAGRIMSSKGCHLLLEALVNIDYKGKLIVAGSLSHESEYSEYILGFKGKLDVRFIGLIRDKSELFGYLNNARFFVFPSLNESMSMMLLEAVSVKVPVIASDIVPNRDIFDDNQMLFFENNNVEDLGNKIAWALENDEAMKAMAENAYQRGIIEYDWETISLKYKDVYDKILS